MMNNELHKLGIWISQLFKKNNINTKELLRVINELDSRECEAIDNKKRIVFLVIPWMMTAIPYQYILFAYICKYWGHDVSILWNDRISFLEGDTSLEQKYISRFLKKLKYTKMQIYQYSDFDINLK